MSVVDVLTELGGVATRRQLVERIGRAALDDAVAAKAVLVQRRGVCRLPAIESAAAIARAAGGVLGLTSAALDHGWAVKLVPEKPHITLRRGIRVHPDLHRSAFWHRADLTRDQLNGLTTSREVTLEQCLRQLPFDEALAVADSASRDGESAMLRRVATNPRGPGSAQLRRVATLADAEAANPFESVLRAIATEVDGLLVRPQVLIRSVDPWARPDLVDEDLRIILEADSFEWHGNRAALRADSRRYDRLVADGWWVLRFAWEDVMFDQDFVRKVIERTVGRAQVHTKAAALRGDVA